MTYKNWIKNKIFKLDEFQGFAELMDKNDHLSAGGLFGSSKVLFLSYLNEIIKKPIIFVCKNENEAKEMKYDFETFGTANVFYFPSVETTPYRTAIVDEAIISDRLEVLKNIIFNENNNIYLLSADTLLFHITPKEKFIPYLNELKKGNNYNLENLSGKLVESGYIRVDKVLNPGEFSIRGDIVDIYYSISKNPVRIDFFGNIIEEIKFFDPETQVSDKTINSVIIPPHKEFLYSEKDKNKAKEKLYKLNGNNEEKDEIYEKILNFQNFDGEQYFLNLFYEKSSFLDYFNEPILVLNDYKTIKNCEKSLYTIFEESYHSTALKRIPKIEPEKILFTLDECYLKSKKIIECNYFEDKKKFDVEFDFKGIPSYSGNLELFKKDFFKYHEEKYKIILFANNTPQQERLEGVLNAFNPVDDQFDFAENNFSIYPSALSDGFISEKNRLFFITDYEIFGKRKKMSKHFYSKRSEIIDSFTDLNVGDYVVHINHGIGKFLGIERVKSMGIEKDYIAILYADNDKIFIPVEQLNFVQKYISEGFAKPKLDKIGAKGWSHTKERVKRSIEELARELIKLYSYRIQQKGFNFLPDTPWQKEFEAKFPFEETEDQLITLEEVKRDMESIKCMDRLICGDVGFGKTEIAIRAGFKAVMSGKQVIILVPTTILCEQHYENFKERLKDYPISVEMLSRFRTRQEQNEIVKKLKNGDIDIIIGTHRLLSDDIAFKNPGLFIIDEEHKFGVKNKEKLKQIRKTIDSLSLTATPIPRTLHMALSSIRNISIINTPPVDRQSVETYVTGYNEEILTEAVKREIERRGQCFFLYNRVKSIYTMKSYLKKIMPDVKIAVAHGQMDEEELDEVIHNFINHQYDMLLTTTIIESGIDMPRVNTIFIDKSDKFGLAQLYQLRGRVGRSDKKAYAYFFYDPDIVLTEDAMKRLRVISEYTELGSGFKVAMKDMEIRGAGNLLGPEQSGDILAVGYELYCKLLQEALNELAPEEAEELKKEKNEVYLDLQYTGYIPDFYIKDSRQKMEFYKKIASIIHTEEIDVIKKSLIDRFGKIPDEVISLFFLSEIRILCKKLNINEMIESSERIEIKFSNVSDLNMQNLMKTINSSNGEIFLKPKYHGDIAHGSGE